MSTKKMDVKLTVSTRMNEGSGRENSYIRIPKRARKQFETRTDKITVSYNNKTIALEIKAAFKEDIDVLKAGIADGSMTPDEAKCLGFVTSATLEGLMGKRKTKPKYCYLSDDIEDIMLGADPEFVLVDPNTLSYKYAESVGGFPRNGLLGSDGPLAEVRPAPANSTEAVITNIKRILSKGRKTTINPYQWYAGATYRSPIKTRERTLHIGGHIHLGDPLVLPSEDKQGIYRQVIRMLDELMAIPLVRVDGPDAHLRRNTAHSNGFGRYGTWGDTRPQVGRFEWRVPSGLWLSHPDFARAVLGTSKAITETCYQMMAEKRFDSKWVRAREGEEGFLKAWSALPAKKAAALVNKADRKLVTAALIKRSETKLKGMENYSKYKENIDEFIRLVRLSSKDRNNINLDIKDTWLNGGKLIKESK